MIKQQIAKGRGVVSYTKKGFSEASGPVFKKRIYHGKKQNMLQIIIGAMRVSNCVSLTLGPGGRLVMLGVDPNSHSPFSYSPLPPIQITKDGATVARALSNYSEHNRLTNIGAKLMIDASERANEECGDVTTTASLIAGYVLSEGSRMLVGGNSSGGESNVNPLEIRKGIQKAVDVLCREID